MSAKDCYLELANANWGGKIDRGYINGKRLYSRIFIKHKKGFCCVTVTCSKLLAMSQISSVRQTPSLVQMRICRACRQPSRLDARGAGHANRAWTAATVRRNKLLALF